MSYRLILTFRGDKRQHGGATDKQRVAAAQGATNAATALPSPPCRARPDCFILGEIDAGSRGCSDSGDVGGEEVDAVSVEVAAGAVVVLGSAWVCMAGEDLGIT